MEAANLSYEEMARRYYYCYGWDNFDNNQKKHFIITQIKMNTCEICTEYGHKPSTYHEAFFCLFSCRHLHRLILNTIQGASQ